MAKSSTKAFTLSELLIALAILGIIAAFAIPKVLQVQQDRKKYALYKETLAMLQQLTYEGIQSGQINHAQGLWITNYTFPRTNAVKICRTNAQTEGCFAQPFPANPSERDQEGFVLHSGVTVAGLSGGWDPGGTNAWEDGLIIDWNGADGPNQDGVDQFYGLLCIGPNACWSGAVKPSQIVGNSAASATLLSDIYKN